MSMIKDLVTAKKLTGKRTKLLAFAIVVGLNVALQLGWLNSESYAQLLSLFVGAGLLTASAHKPG